MALSAAVSPVLAQNNDEDSPTESEYVIDLRCAPIADENYTASITGKLHVTGYQVHHFNVSGDIAATLIAHGDTTGPHQAEASGVFGFYGGGGEIFFAQDDALALLLLNIARSDGSDPGRTALTDKAGITYQTDCAPSTFRLPRVPDRVPERLQRCPLFARSHAMRRASQDLSCSSSRRND